MSENREYDLDDLESIGLKEDDIGILPFDAKREILEEIRRIISIDFTKSQELIDIINGQLSEDNNKLSYSIIFNEIHNMCLQDDDRKYNEYLEDVFEQDLNSDDVYNAFLTSIAYKFLENNGYGNLIEYKKNATERCIEKLEDDSSLKDYFDLTYGDQFSDEDADIKFEEWAQPFISENQGRAEILRKVFDDLDEFCQDLYYYNEIVDYIVRLKSFISQYITNNRVYTEKDKTEFLEYMACVDSDSIFYLGNKVDEFFSSKMIENKKKVYL